MKRIGVFVCHCGTNIAGTVDVKKVVEEVKKHPAVVYAVEYTYMCSDPGQAMIKEAISKMGLEGVIVASCSPSLHENTFRKTVSSEEVNPYLMECANIREQCSWVHKDREAATQKAVKIIMSMVEKLQANKPLKPISIPVTKRALVVGAGIAGMQAALDIANSGYETILLEKESSIGGKMSQLAETFPTLDCASCILTPKMVEVSQHPNIKLMTYSELEEVSGYVGNFKVKVRKKARSIKEDICTGCGECVTNCLVGNEIQLPEVGSVEKDLSVEMKSELDEIIDEYSDEVGPLIPVLQDINQKYNYLPELALRYASERLKVPLAQVYNVATFYTAFSLTPRGKHLIRVCQGTACHVRGGAAVLDELKRSLGIGDGETTEDMNFTLETVNCLGACALGPVVVIDEEYHPTSPAKVDKLLKKYKENGGEVGK
ncbi:MAG: NAD(P)H-dependent oxidoreductase subunit E [Methanomassiliicoccales archaeon]|nr:MAG: NAD(P)H-dependent oxidoreductase subunit E [Methanomassiliicoccales archaeon]